jgi:ankyrin repeat protein
MKNKRIAPTEFHKLLQLDLDTFEHIISIMSSPMELIRLLRSLNHRTHNYQDYNRIIRRKLREFDITESHTRIVNFINGLINSGLTPTEIVDFLRILNFEPNAFENGKSILHKAVRENNTRLVQVLIEAGCNVNAETSGDGDDERSETPLYIASYIHSENITRLLLRAGADPNIKTTWGFTPLIQAASQIQLGIVTLLLESGSDVKVRTGMENDYADQNALDISVQSERSHRVVRLLLNHMDVNSSNTHGDTALHFYLSYGSDPKVLTDLIRAGADVNKKNNDGETPLHICVENNLEDEMIELLQAGADPNVANNSGETVFDILKNGGNTVLYNALIQSVSTGPQSMEYDQDRYYTEPDQWFSFGKKRTFIQKAFKTFQRKGTTGSFTRWCKRKGFPKVTTECIKQGKKSNLRRTRKRAIFAQNIRSKKRQYSFGKTQDIQYLQGLVR